ncbi:ribosome maturation factor RimP [Rhabdothermincola sp.]|uniref:ribosome maturation factor RimP n=1 Tax=Rhabdothermincola sp. TaxID=2820405 RepID=UPI002FE290FC
MSVSERVRAVVEPVVSAQGLELFDLEHAGGVLRVTVDRPGGVDLDTVTATTRAVSRALDDLDPIAGRYTLEVTSPGLERPLRTPAHFRWAVGQRVSLKTGPGFDGPRRLTGELAAATDEDITVVLDEPAGARRTLALADIERARTVFEWGPGPKPGSPSRGSKHPKPSKSPKTGEVNAP